MTIPKNSPPSEEFIQQKFIEQSKADNLLEQTLQLSLLQLSIFKKKLANGGELNDKENTALCAYMRTFAQISKMQKEDKKEKRKEVSEMSDDELRAEIAKLTSGISEADL